MMTDPTTAGTLGTYQFLLLSAVDSSQAPIAVDTERKTIKNSLYTRSVERKIAASKRPTATDLESDRPPGALTSDIGSLNLEQFGFFAL